jgi:DNA-binding beta-propeller fold protein YncE
MRGIQFIAVLLFIASCKKPEPPSVPEKYENGILVLNEGLFEQNNASMTFYDGAEAFQLVFKSENGRGLGDTANDFDTYSLLGKEYIIVAVNLSSQIEIIERKTLQVVAQIPLFDGVNARQPRDIAIYGTRAYVCNFDGTVAVIDLISYTIIDLIEVGANPDGLAIVGDYLYVSNSGGLDYPVYDSTMSVINLSTLSLVETFETRINSTQMIVDEQGEIYLLSNGNYTDIPSALLRIDPTTNSVIQTVEMQMTSMEYTHNGFYFYNEDEQAVYFYNTVTEAVNPMPFLSVADYETFHGIIYDAENERLFCVDANGYVNSSTVNTYTLSGEFLFEFKAGLLATDMIFNN